MCGQKALADRCYAGRCGLIVDAKSRCHSVLGGPSKSQKLQHTQCYLRIIGGGLGLSRSCPSDITAIIQLQYATQAGRARAER